MEAKRKQEQLEIEEQAKIEEARQKEAAKKEVSDTSLFCVIKRRPVVTKLFVLVLGSSSSIRIEVTLGT